MKTIDLGLFSTLTLAATLACGGSQAEPQTADADTASSEEGEKAAPPPLEKWDASATDQQKAAFMVDVIVPAMAPVFKEADAEKYADFGCATCHGPEVPVDSEPDEHLPHLKAVDGNITAFADSPEVAQFMAQKVVPAMAAAMGVEPYDVETGQGFGCNGCHAVDM